MSRLLLRRPSIITLSEYGLEVINRNAERLNEEVEDVLTYQVDL